MSAFEIKDAQGNDLPAEVFLERLRKGVYHKQAMALARQEALMAASPERRHLKEAELELSLTPTVYHHWRRRFAGQTDLEGNPINPWEHDEFIRDMKRDNDCLRPRIAKPGNRVGWTPELKTESGKRTLLKAGKYAPLPKAS